MKAAYVDGLWCSEEEMDGAEDQSRTDDTWIFSPLLYHLSYLGVPPNLPYSFDDVNVTYARGLSMVRGEPSRRRALIAVRRKRTEGTPPVGTQPPAREDN